LNVAGECEFFCNRKSWISFGPPPSHALDNMPQTRDLSFSAYLAGNKFAAKTEKARPIYPTVIAAGLIRPTKETAGSFRTVFR